MPKFNVGDSAEISKTITHEDIVAFAEVSTDKNPIHLDEEYAKTTRFGGRIAHGMLSASFISAVIGMYLPGPGALYLSQSLKFKLPVRIGDTVTTTGTITAIRPDKPIFTISTVCTNQNGEVVTDGEAVVMYLSES